MTHAVGSLVRCRGREWVVLPQAGEDPDLLMLRPLGGTGDEACGVYLPLEPVEPASFDLPNPANVGDHLSCRLLRDAVRLGFRASAGPFRSFARISVEPRPYQLVPLMMALRLDPIRLLIADDVGIGKTVEACLIARELLDRGEATRLAVLCPPHLAEQWQGELRDKFHIEAELVLSSTVGRLERQCGMNQSLFEVFPFVIVSTDYIKSSRRRDDFLRACPNLVIVDEAHTCAASLATRSGRHHRHELLRALSADEQRHLILVTATPHSGIEASFRSLLSLLHSRFAELPDDLSGKQNEAHRRALAAHLVQRRRADIAHYLDADTPFPTREEKEVTYKLTPEYKTLFDKVLYYVRERVRETGRPDATLSPTGALVGGTRPASCSGEQPGGLRRLPCVPRHAGSRRRTRKRPTKWAVVRSWMWTRRTKLMSPMSCPAPTVSRTKRLPRTQNAAACGEMAKLADSLCGDKDAKLAIAVTTIKELLRDGFSPIIFCRFIATAEYLAAALRERLRGVEVAWATGKLPPEEREQRVEELGALKAEGKKIVLVATDCLSEGVNLQHHFDAVIQFDLGWSPVRHEQRDGRVDRFGQPKDVVRSVLPLRNRQPDRRHRSGGVTPQAQDDS